MKPTASAMMALFALSMTGCVEPQAGSTALPNGDIAHSVKCSGKSQQCMNEAARVCNGPYQVIDSESHAGGIAADLLPGPVTWYGMTFSCGKSDGRLPLFPFNGQEYKPAQIRPPSTTYCSGGANSVMCTTY